MVSSLLDAWVELRGSEQSILTEAVEQLSVNADLASVILKVLNDACDKLKTQSEFSNIHVLLLVKQKFLSLYSSKNAHDLCASDILLMILMCWVINHKKQIDNETDSNGDGNGDILLPHDNSSREEEAKPFGAKLSNPTLEDITNLFSMISRLVISKKKDYCYCFHLLPIIYYILHYRRIKRIFPKRRSSFFST